MSKKNGLPPPSRALEASGVAGVFLALFLIISLASYTQPEPGGVIGNWGGRLGGFLAQVLFGFLGLSAAWIPLLLLVFSFQAITSSLRFERLPAMLIGTSGVILSSSVLLGLPAVHQLALFDRQLPVAGFLGELLSGYLREYLGGPGSALLFAAVFLVSLMLALDFSPSSLVRASWDWLKARSGGRELKRAAEPRERRIRHRQEEPPEVSGDVSVPKVREPVQPKGNEEESGFSVMPATKGTFTLPGLSLLDKPPERDFAADREYYYGVSKQLEEKLADFNVVGKVVGISPGPVITTYEFAPAPGVKINRIVSLAEDLALGLKVESVRIAGSIPGRGAIGIEIPNRTRHLVHIRDILGHEKFQKSASPLTMGLGMDVVGNPVVADLARMPHLLIAGATGSGKSVAVNTIIASILFKATPDEVRLLLVDPKRIELSCYESIPHLLHPVVVDPKLASRALRWAVREMERRYQLMEEAKVKSLVTYNETAEEKLPLIVIIIDELADLMMVSSREVEDAVARLAQMARAAGMHLILATQRPSVDVLTGLIKANFPTRMSFKVSSKVDSRTILDTSGAEHLLGAGDMLFLPPGTAKLQRIHGAYISESEIERIVSFLKEQGAASYDETVLAIEDESSGPEGEGDGELDEKYDEAVALVTETGQASISMLQRRLRVGYNRAARMIETMEREGIVSAADGSKPREVLVRRDYPS